MSPWWLLLIIPAVIVATLWSVAAWFARDFMRWW